MKSGSRHWCSHGVTQTSVPFSPRLPEGRLKPEARTKTPAKSTPPCFDKYSRFVECALRSLLVQGVCAMLTVLHPQKAEGCNTLASAAPFFAGLICMGTSSITRGLRETKHLTLVLDVAAFHSCPTFCAGAPCVPSCIRVSTVAPRRVKVKVPHWNRDISAFIMLVRTRTTDNKLRFLFRASTSGLLHEQSVSVSEQWSGVFVSSCLRRTLPSLVRQNAGVQCFPHQ